MERTVSLTGVKIFLACSLLLFLRVHRVISNHSARPGPSPQTKRWSSLTRGSGMTAERRFAFHKELWRFSTVFNCFYVGTRHYYAVFANRRGESKDSATKCRLRD